MPSTSGVRPEGFEPSHSGLKPDASTNWARDANTGPKPRWLHNNFFDDCDSLHVSVTCAPWDSNPQPPGFEAGPSTNWGRGAKVGPEPTGIRLYPESPSN